MPYDVQEFANDTGSHKTLTLGKHLAKKRGRSVNRQERLRGGRDTRVIRDQLAVSFAHKEYRREMRQYETAVSETRGESIPMPQFLHELRVAVKIAEQNLQTAKLVERAMSKYPPLQ